ncbi:PilN domain-containing protein [Candidatus Omnitrophota bacterium]
MDRENKVLIVPRRMVFVRLMDIPSIDAAEIEKMIYFQAIKDIPYPKEEMIISYRNIGSYKDGFSSVMLAIANRHMIQEMMRRDELADIKVQGIRLETELLYLFLLKEEALRQDKTSLVMHIGSEYSEVMIIDKTRPVFTRGFKNNEKFLEEIDRSVLSYEKDKDNPEIEDILVAYASNIDIREARPCIEGHFKIPVSFYEYDEDLSSIDLPTEIDFAPKEMAGEKARLQKTQKFIVSYALAVFIIILVLASLSFKIYKKRRVLKMLSAGINQMQYEAEELDMSFKKTRVARNQKERGKLIAEIFKRFYTLTPSDISISVLDYNGKDVILHKGTSKDALSVFEFAKKLENSKYFKKAEVEYVTKRKREGAEVTDFNIRCQIDMGPQRTKD